jgi:hypothetical protein
MSQSIKTILLLGILCLIIAVAILGVMYIGDYYTIEQFKEELLRSSQIIGLVTILGLGGAFIIGLFTKK